MKNLIFLLLIIVFSGCSNKLIRVYKKHGAVMEKINMKKFMVLSNFRGDSIDKSSGTTFFQVHKQKISRDNIYFPGASYGLKIEDDKSKEDFIVGIKDYKIIDILRQVIYNNDPSVVNHHLYFKDGSLKQLYFIKYIKNEFTSPLLIFTGKRTTYNEKGRVIDEIDFDKEYPFTIYDVFKFVHHKYAKGGISELDQLYNPTTEHEKGKKYPYYWRLMCPDPDKPNTGIVWILDGKTGAVYSTGSMTFIRKEG